MQSYIVEMIGTTILVSFGTGAAILSGGDVSATGTGFGIGVVVLAASWLLSRRATRG